jgi:hypothetical protein
VKNKQYEFLPSWYSSVTEEYQDGKNSYCEFFGLVPSLQLAINICYIIGLSLASVLITSFTCIIFTMKFPLSLKVLCHTIIFIPLIHIKPTDITYPLSLFGAGNGALWAVNSSLHLQSSAATLAWHKEDFPGTWTAG